ncbi:MAG: amidohydrolase family protein [Planctomycetota bacterium]
MVARLALTAAALFATCPPTPASEPGFALRCAKILTCDEDDTIVNRGMILLRGDKIEYIGKPVEVPAGYRELDLGAVWASPGMVELHAHVVGPGFDINDMVYPVNADLSTRPSITPSNSLMRMGTAAGVTTMFLIPGSGTSMGGFGVLFKPKIDAGYEECVLRDPGGMKAAQNYNPQRGAGDVGAGWSGLSWLMEEANNRAAAAFAQGRDDFGLRNLIRVHAGELPVLIHCASAEGVANTVRMWKVRYGTKCVVSHGSWDGYKAAGFAAKHGVPVNHGPRTMDYSRFFRSGRVVGGAAEYTAAGVPLFSLNTDSPVVPQEELFLQGSMSARLGADAYQMLRALTTHPAQSILVGDRVGSLEVGKDADIVLSSGDPLDPRSRVEVVFIDGEIQYSRQDDGQWF